MVRRWLAGAAAMVLMGLFNPAVWAQDTQPSDTQIDLATFFSSLGVGESGGTVSSAYKPVPLTEPSEQASFAVWAATVDMDEETELALMAELAALCEQAQVPTDFSFTTAICPTGEAVNDLFGQPDPPVAVVAEREEGWDLGIRFQLTVVGSNLSRPVYAGQEGDPNTGHNTGYDLYWAGDSPALGLTTHNKTGFDFVDFESGIVLIKNPGWIGYLFPASVIGELTEPEVWIDDGGWDHAPVPVEFGALYFGSPDFVAASIAGDTQTEDETEPEPQPETEPEPEPQPEDTAEPAVEEQQAAQPESEPTGQGLPLGLVIGGGAAVIAAAGVGVLAATRRRKGKCETLLEDYDKAYEAWVKASRAMNRARDAYALGETAGTEGARAAQEAAEQAEKEAYASERRAWNTYLDCIGEARAATRQAPVRNESPPAPVGTDDARTSAVVSEAPATAPPDETAVAPPPVKPVPCADNAVKDLEVLETLRGSLTLAYTISSGTEGIRATEDEAAETVDGLNEVGDQISEINDAIQEHGSGAGALIADAASTVLELTARLGAGAAAAANQMLENHRVYDFTYEEHRVIVDMRWTKFLRCVRGSWQCFYDLEVKDFHEITIPQTESFEGHRESRDKRMRPFIQKGERAVARDRPKLESFMKAHRVGPC